MYHRKYYPLLAVFGLVLLLCSQAFGQIVVELKETRRDFMVGEPVVLKLTLHNNSDETIDLRDIGDMPWLFLRVTQRGAGNRTISPIARAKFPPMTLKPGQSLAHTLSLKSFYNFVGEGSYSCTATVCLQDGKTTFSSVPARFDLVGGSALWSQQVHVKGKSLRLSVCCMHVGGKARLFGQVMNEDTRQVVASVLLGQFLNFAAPRCMMDGGKNVHVLFQSNTTYFTYAVFSPSGARLSSQLFKRSGGVPIGLVATGSGIQVAGAVPYVPEKEAEEGRNANERPY